MKYRRFALAVALLTALTVVAPILPVSAATKFKIKLVTNSRTFDVGDEVTFSGTVTPNARGKEIVLEQKKSGGPWSKLDTTKVNSASEFRFLPRVMVSPGVKRFRAFINPPNTYSNEREVKIYEWHYLADDDSGFSGVYDGCWDYAPVRIGGKLYAHSMLFRFCGTDLRSSDWGVWNLRRKCMTFRAKRVGLTDSSSANAQARIVIGTDGAQKYKQTFGKPNKRFGKLDEPSFSIARHSKLRLEAILPRGKDPDIGFAKAQIRCLW